MRQVSRQHYTQKYSQNAHHNSSDIEGKYSYLDIMCFPSYPRYEVNGGVYSLQTIESDVAVMCLVPQTG